jgi:hypothetical protein
MLSQAHTHHPFKLCGMDFTATLFGGPRDWSLNQLSDPRAEEYRQRLGYVLIDLQVGRTFATNTTQFNANLLEPAQFDLQLRVGSHMLSCAPHLPADGTSLKIGEAIVQSPSGCLVFVAARPGRDPWVPHGGRWCFIDPHEVRYGSPDEGRRNYSVVYAVMEKLEARRPEEIAEIEVAAFWSIPAARFPHDRDDEKHGEINDSLYNHLYRAGMQDCVLERGRVFYPDLPRILAHQFIARGVPEKNIDLTRAYLPPQEVHLNGSKGAPRNLVIIKRRH